MLQRRQYFVLDSAGILRQCLAGAGEQQGTKIKAVRQASLRLRRRHARGGFSPKRDGMGRGGDTLPRVAPAVQTRTGRARHRLSRRAPAAVAPSRHAARSRRHGGCGRRSSPRSARLRATNRQRWQSSGSRSAHMTQTRDRAIGVEQAAEAGSVFRPRRHRFVVGDAIAIEAIVARPAAQCVAHRRIADPQPPAMPRASFARTTERSANRARVRTSATRFTPASRSSARKRSSAILEWPMLNRSNDGMVVN